MMANNRITWALATVIWVVGLAWADTVSAQQAARPPGPEPIIWIGNGLSLELAAMPIEPMMAFFLSRGFTFEQARNIAKTGCIFRSSIGNSEKQADAPPVYIDVSKWSLLIGNTTRAYRGKEQWLARFEKDGVSTSARIAFQWGTFPSRQTFYGDDYNWGIHAFDLAPGTRFDLTVVWRRGDQEHTITLKDLKCSPEGASGEDN